MVRLILFNGLSPIWPNFFWQISSLLKLKDEDEYKWEPEYQKSFDELKKYLIEPPVLIPPQGGKPLKLYIAAMTTSIESLLAQDNDQGKEQTIHYLS